MNGDKFISEKKLLYRWTYKQSSVGYEKFPLP